VKLENGFIENGHPSKKAIDEIERRLRIQRNKPVMPTDIGFMGIERSRRTGGVAVRYRENGTEDRATKVKIEEVRKDKVGLFHKFSGMDGIRECKIPLDLSEITGSADNSWLAIVHADGNSIGSHVQNISPGEFKKFSENLQKATEEAAQEAFRKTIPEPGTKERYPIRPVILGGDDVTVIIRADLALSFTEEYLKAFEKKTKEKLNKCLTACAGIAYIKEKYPFHYGVRLAEELTKEAKKMSKGENETVPPSSLSFYKVQSSFVESLGDMRARTHHKIAENLGFDANEITYSYPIESKESLSTGDIRDSLEKLKEYSTNESGSVGKLKHWLTLLQEDKPKADFFLERIKEINEQMYKGLKLEDKKRQRALFDILQLESFNQQ